MVPAASRGQVPSVTSIPLQTAQTALDRIALTASEKLTAPVAFVWMVDPERRMLMSCAGMPAPIAMLLTYPFCSEIVASGLPLTVADGRADPKMAKSAAVRDGTVTAYAGRPIVGANGRTVGALCVMDPQPREWTMPQLALLSDLAAQIPMLGD
jgi:GAF domain-containing protein